MSISISSPCLHLAIVGLVLLACQNGNGNQNAAITVGNVERVRPDVREYIESAVSSEYEKQAALQFAGAMQGHLDAADNAGQMKQLLPVLLRSIHCISYVFPSSQDFPADAKAQVMQGEIEARTFNTKERSLAYARSMKHLGGSTWSSPPLSEYSKDCAFDLTGFSPKAAP